MDTLLLSKLLPLFVFPLGLAWFLLLAAIAAYRFRRVQLGIIVMALAVLWLPSTRWAAGALGRPLEWMYPGTNDLPSADAIVVLGGSAEPAIPPRTGVEIGASGDRLLRAAELFQLRKAPLVVVSGGRSPWSGVGGTEAADMSALLSRLGVPAEAIIEEGRSRNTRENVLQVSKILEARGADEILLVTSALHMPRALALFARTGLSVVAAPTDFELVRATQPGVAVPKPMAWSFTWIPEVRNLAYSTDALREYFALMYYRMRGLVD